MVHENLENKKMDYTALQAPIVSRVYAEEPCPAKTATIKALLLSYYERRQGLAE